MSAPTLTLTARTAVLTPAEVTTRTARAFGVAFAAAHPDLPAVGIGEQSAAAWSANGGAGWAARVCAAAAATARCADLHPAPVAVAADTVALRCGGCRAVFRGTLDGALMDLQDHEADTHR